MRSLKYLVIALMVDLTVLYNMERISFGEEYYHFINIQGFVYGVVIIAVISTILVPILWRSHVAVSLALWVAIYLTGKLTFFQSSNHPLIGNFYTFVTVTEIVLLGFSIFLAHQLARALRDFEEAVKNITLTGVHHRLRHVDDATREIENELVRSRRHHRPLSVIVIQPEPASIQATLNRAVQEVQKAMMSRYVITSLVPVIANSLRRSDIVLEQREKGRFIIFSPESDCDNATSVAKRIQSTVADRLDVTVNCGIAAFPDEALTFHELVCRAEAQLPKPAQLPTVSTHSVADVIQRS